MTFDMNFPIAMSELATSAKANLKAAQFHLAQAKAQYDSAKLNLESAKRLYDAVVVLSDNVTTGNSNQKLCASCTQIDFNALFKQRGKVGKSSSTHRRAVGYLFNTVENQSTCSCCRFLLEACQLGRAPGDITLYASSKARDHTIYLSDDPNGKPWYTKAGIAADLPAIPYFWIQVGLPSETGEPHVCITLELPALSPDSHSLPRIRDSVEAFNGSVNYEVIQAWLTTCNQHSPSCGKPALQDYVYYLIDVHTRLIVRCSSARRYVALSYVWGKGAQSMYQREKTSVDLYEPADGKLFGESWTGWKVPYLAAQTIEDAMTFVKRLGEQYLWTDLYCIDQNDEPAKREQIMLMDKIYASSYLTIVAMDGENADWGLPGITRPLEHTRQPTLNLGIGQLTATYIFSTYHHFGKSKWDSRAWTLQERLLSSRCIFFRRSSISMMCQREMFHDSMRVYMIGTQPRVLTRLGEEQYWEDGSTIDLNETEWDYKHYDSFISTYTNRYLTNQSDALNACRGILNMITMNTGQEFIFGFPVRDFRRALLWKPHHDNIITRRANFPSRSWAGWIGRIEYAYWVGDMADYAEEDTHRPKKRLRGSELSVTLPEVTASVEYLPQAEADGGLIRLSSEVARFHLCRQRVDGEVHVGLRPKSLQPPYAVGDHWTLVAGEARTHKLRDTAGEHEVFEETDFFFRAHPQYRAILENFQVGRDPAEFLLVERWPKIRDSKASNRWRVNMVSALLINELSSGTYERLASILIPLHEWQAAEPCSRLVVLV